MEEEISQQLQQMQQLVALAAQALAEKGDTRMLEAVQQMGTPQSATAGTVPTQNATMQERAATTSREAAAVK